MRIIECTGGYTVGTVNCGLWTDDILYERTFLSDGGRTLNTTYEAYYSLVATS